MLTARMYEAVKSDVEYAKDQVLRYVKAKGRILDYLQKADYITNENVRELCGFTRQQARQALEKMREEGIIILEGKGRGARYIEKKCV